MKYIIATLVIVGLGGWWFYNVSDDSSKNNLTAAQVLLLNIGDKCAGIAENSTANKVPIVEFQKLELLSQRITVLTNCMQDNGYYKNSAWMVYAKPIAEANAKAENISYDEALATFSRIDIQVFEPSAKHPPYWFKPH